MYEYKARYVSAYDGDSVRLDCDLGFNIWMKNQVIRLYGIDTPELRGKDREEGLKARDYVRERLTECDELIIKTHKDKKGKYGRWLAEIYVDGVNLNQELVKEGMAKEYMV